MPGAPKRSRAHEGEGRLPTRGAQLTHDEVARALGVSRQLVVKIEAAALRKLRESPVLKELF